MKCTIEPEPDSDQSDKDSSRASITAIDGSCRLYKKKQEHDELLDSTLRPSLDMRSDSEMSKIDLRVRVIESQHDSHRWIMQFIRKKAGAR